LDTHRLSQPGCGIDDDQYEWLEADLRKNARRDTYLFYHAPLPMEGPVGFSESHPGLNALWGTWSVGTEEAYRIIDSHPNVIAGFAGHLHTFCEDRRGQFTQYVGASCSDVHMGFRRVLLGPGANE
jgi:3',5'-cyclic AMP phosphodiesterase CpdA